MYVDFEYYRGVYGGSSLTEQSFPAAVREAEAYIRYLTHVNGDIFAESAQADAIKRAVCATAEAYHGAVLEQEQGGGVRSESKDGLSVSFVVARREGETLEEYARRHMYQAARARLLPTGWLNRKVGCVHGHKCGGGDGL